MKNKSSKYRKVMKDIEKARRDPQSATITNLMSFKAHKKEMLRLKKARGSQFQNMNIQAMKSLNGPESENIIAGHLSPSLYLMESKNFKEYKKRLMEVQEVMGIMS